MVFKLHHGKLAPPSFKKNTLKHQLLRDITENLDDFYSIPVCRVCAPSLAKFTFSDKTKICKKNCKIKKQTLTSTAVVNSTKNQTCASLTRDTGQCVCDTKSKSVPPSPGTWVSACAVLKANPCLLRQGHGSVHVQY